MQTGYLRICGADRTVCGSIKENQGLQELVDVLEKMISERSIYVEKVIPYAEAGKIQLIRQYGQLLGKNIPRAA